MILPMYLAMTAEEFSCVSPRPSHPAWMACHFSPYGTGLTGLPRDIPPGTLLMLNDRIPLAGHDPGQIQRQLTECIEAFASPAVVLDFQRRDTTEAAKLAAFLCDKLPCPVVVPPWYGEPLACPLLLPPVPPHKLPEEYIAPWQGRQLWLEISMDAERAAITERGTTFTPAPLPPEGEKSWESDQLCCRYRHKIHDDHISVTLWREESHLQTLLEKAGQLGIQAAIGLHQQLGHVFGKENTANGETPISGA